MKQPGDSIGKYRLESVIGSGGNGTVYEALDPVLGRRVAIKLLKPKLAEDVQLAARFRSEAEAMARLNHPNVVAVYDLVADGGQWAIVMELASGGETVDTLVTRAGALSAERALRIAAHAARGLGHAHKRGIIHRDVKPGNLLVFAEDGEERVKVTDFGIARLLGRSRITGESITLGTLHYMAPEQTGDAAVDARADVYALGATLYRMVTGTVPFPYDQPARLLTALVSESPVAPTWLVPSLRRDVEGVILECLAKRPEERPPDGDALAARLDMLASAPATGIPETRSHPVILTSIPPAGPTGKPSRADDETRTALMIGVGLMLLLSLICLVSGAFVLLRCT